MVIYFDMETSCQFSFDDLFQAAFGRVITEKERRELYGLSQTDRNQRVGEWAKKAGWQTEDRVGTDGIEYRAFWQPK